ncbi:ABC transporter permease [Candidatus Poriferisocius sp.]|uniref:ABC transporter permease n=1 Tax=Candidatus Poriferisocius sp. TaxID=3101276 RepID=UPI003B012454
MSDSTTTHIPSSESRGPRNRFNVLIFLSRYGVVFASLASILAFAILNDRYIQLDGILSSLSLGSPLLMLALGLTVVLTMGDFDLSVTGLTSAAGAIVVILMVNHDWSWGLAVFVGLIFCLVAGSLNGLLVSYAGMPSFITTLATGLILIGTRYESADGRNITGSTSLPDIYRDFGIGEPDPLLGVRTPVWIAAGLAILLWLLMSKTEVGRYMYAIGGNPEAARLSGINVKALRASGFALVGFMALFAAVTSTARTASSVADSGFSTLLGAYAAAFLGAAASRRTLFNVPGTVLGVIFLQAVDRGLTIEGYSTGVRDIAKGCILLLAMAFTLLGASRR